MAEATNTPPDQEPLERSFTDRRPLTATFLAIEFSLVLLAGGLFAIGDPMAPKATTASVIGGLVTMVALMMAIIGVLIFVGTYLIKVYTDYA